MNNEQLIIVCITAIIVSYILRNLITININQSPSTWNTNHGIKGGDQDD